MDSSLDAVFDAAGRQYDIDPTVLKAVALQESRGNVNTPPSSAGAIGLMQFMPKTAQAVGIDPTNPVEAIFGAAKLLDQNLKQYGNLPDALKAYNAGNPSRWNNPETAAYVPGVAAKYQQIVANKRVPTGAGAADDALLGSFLGGSEKPSGTSEPTAPTVSPGDDQLLKGFLASPAPSAPVPEAKPAPTPEAAAASAASGIPASGPPGVPEWLHNAAITTVAGLNRAAHDVGDLPVQGGAYLADKLGLTQGALPAMQAEQAQARDAFQQNYGSNPLAQGVRIAGDIGATLLPGGLVGRGVTAGGNALLGTGSVLARMGTGIASGAAQGATGAALTAGGSDQPLPQQLATGAAVGGALGGVVPLVGKALGAGTVTAEDAQIARNAQAMGVPVYGGQITANPMVKFANSVIGRLPLSGGGAAAEAQQAAIGRVQAAAMGQVADKVTPAVMQAAKRDTGKIFDEVASKVTLQADDNLLGALGKVESDVSALPASEQKHIVSQITNILEAASDGDGAISGKTYQALTAKGSPLDRAMQSGDPNVRYYSGQIRNALDDALERYTPPELQGRLTQARSQWKAMKTLEDLVEKYPSGNIPPNALMGPVRQSYGGGGDLGMAYNIDPPPLVKLAQLGKLIREPQSSGTPERLAILGALADPTGHTAAAVGSALLGGRLAGAALRSDAFTNMLLNPGVSGVNPLAVQTARQLEDLRARRP
jgi:hypothetical protein